MKNGSILLKFTNCVKLLFKITGNYSNKHTKNPLFLELIFYYTRYHVTCYSFTKNNIYLLCLWESLNKIYLFLQKKKALTLDFFPPFLSPPAIVENDSIYRGDSNIQGKSH